MDPMEPPKFRHKKVPRGAGSPPVPIMHSPPRAITVKDQQDWKIPPCISNWKNPKVRGNAGIVIVQHCVAHSDCATNASWFRFTVHHTRNQPDLLSQLPVIAPTRFSNSSVDVSFRCLICSAGSCAVAHHPVV